MGAEILLNPARRPVIAHRGASAEAPENTLEAFRLAVEQKCDAFEFDVHLTRDGVPVLMHDPTLRRTCGRPDRVADLALAELQAADAGATFTAADGSFPWRNRGVRAPSLVEVLREFPDMPMLIEIKDPAAQDATAVVLRADGAVARCVVASFRHGALRAFRNPPFLRGASRVDILGLLARARLGLPARPRCLCYAVPDYWKGKIEIPTEPVVRASRRAEVPVHVWTVDDPKRARELWARGVSGIITNRPGVIRAARGAESAPQ